MSAVATGSPTPAPWTFTTPSFDGFATIRDSDGEAIAAIAYRDGYGEALANARLFAALPALLAALRYGFDLYGFDGPDGRWPIAQRHEFDRLARVALGLPERS